MHFDHINNTNTLPMLFQSPTWQKVFKWLKEDALILENGRHELDGDQLYVNLESYDTLPRAECHFESHREYIDVQYCLSGEEFIDWSPVNQLTPLAPYDSDRDVIFYASDTAILPLRLQPGWFAIFGPGDGHRPKINIPGETTIRKAVVKWAISEG